MFGNFVVQVLTTHNGLLPCNSIKSTIVSSSIDICRQLSRRRRLQAANYKDRGTRLHRPVVVASPAGRTGLREARAAPDRAPAVLLSSL